MFIPSISLLEWIIADVYKENAEALNALLLNLNSLGPEKLRLFISTLESIGVKGDSNSSNNCLSGYAAGYILGYLASAERQNERCNPS